MSVTMGEVQSMSLGLFEFLEEQDVTIETAMAALALTLARMSIPGRLSPQLEESVVPALLEYTVMLTSGGGKIH